MILKNIFQKFSLRTSVLKSLKRQFVIFTLNAQKILKALGGILSEFNIVLFVIYLTIMFWQRIKLKKTVLNLLKM